MPTGKISDSKSTIQSGILTQSAGESLVDLTIDPNSPKGENGLAPLEEYLEKTQVHQNMATNETSWMVSIFDGSDSETVSTIPIHHMHSLNDCLTL